MKQHHDTRPRLVGRPGHNKGEMYDLELPTPAEVRLLLDRFNRGATGCRNRAFVAVLYGGGLRVSEAVGANARRATAGAPARKAKVGLRPSDWDPKTRTLRVQKASGKGDKSRPVSLAPVFAALLDNWIARRKELGINGTSPLFCQLDGSPWRAQAASEAIKYAGREAGIEKRLNCHSFRHAHAVRLDEAGVRSSLIQRGLGHSNLAITTRYLQGISAGDLAEAVGNVDWGLEEPAQAQLEVPA